MLCLGWLRLCCFWLHVQGATLVGGRISTSGLTPTWNYNESRAIDPSSGIYANGSGSATLSASQSRSQPQDSAATSASNMSRETIFPVFTTVSTMTQEIWETWTTDCEGIVHVRGTSPTASSIYSTTLTWTNYTVPSSTTSESSTITQSSTTICTASPDCMIMGDHVRLIYWPVTTIGANSCGTNGTTISASNTELKTIVTLGTTFTSPTAYISFHSLSAWDWNCRTQLGPGLSNTMIPILPENLSSARGYHLGRSAYSFNLADLNGFVTSAAFFQMQGYDWSEPRDTIFDDLYFPTIWLPNRVTEMLPEWTTCSLSPFGVNDPPVALTSVAYLTTEESKPIQTPGYELSKPTPGATASTTQASNTLPLGHDAIPTPYPTSVSPLGHTATAGHASTEPAATALGDYIAAALGASPSPSAKPTQIVLGSIASQVSVEKQNPIPLSEIYNQMITEMGERGSGMSTATAYGIVYTVVEGHTAASVGNTMLVVGGGVIEIDGYVVSAATGGVAINGVTIPYIAAETSGKTSLSSSLPVSSSALSPSDRSSASSTVSKSPRALYSTIVLLMIMTILS